MAQTLDGLDNWEHNSFTVEYPAPLLLYFFCRHENLRGTQFTISL
jgi:hypothetical protein